jgi:alpha-ketoglutarate-dependent taurine dioxygenase
VFRTRSCWQWVEGAISNWDNRLVQHFGVPDQTTDRYIERIAVCSGPMLSIADWEATANMAA